MKNWFGSLFGRQDQLGLQQPTPDWLTPEHVERLIDEAGREAVFDRARALGWTQTAPPLWAWQQIALEVKAAKLAEAQQRLAGMTPAGFA